MGPRRSLIPLHWRDLSLWPRPDDFGIPLESRERFRLRKLAVEMYALDHIWADIEARTSKTSGEVRRLVRRCVTDMGGGQIWGFLALVPGVYLDYVRTAPVRHLPGIGSGGCAGALTQVFMRYEDLQDLVDDLLDKSKTPDGVALSRYQYSEIALEFRKALRAEGGTEEDWPENTDDKGVEAIRRYDLRRAAEHPTRYVKGRHGKEAARRGAVGTGRRSILRTFRPYSCVQMDYQKIDCASIVVLKHPIDGSEVEVPVARWHIGLMCEERKRLVIGVHVVLETTPSADAAIGTIASAVMPIESPDDPERMQAGLDTGPGNLRFLPLHFVPETLGQCWSAAKVDNAWSNDAGPTVDLLVDCIGCAVNFGRVRGWWRRAIVERIFLELTKRGAQRLSATFGSGPKDGRVDRPIEQAIKHRILVSDLEAIVRGVVREHNERPTEGLLGLSPLGAMKSAIANPLSGFLPQKLPPSHRDNPRVCYSRARLRVAGNVRKNSRPYVESYGVNWTNPLLSRSYALVRKEIDVYFNIFDSALAYAVDPRTGEDLGWLQPAGVWADLHLHRRDVKLIYRWARKQRRRMDDPQTVRGYARAKKRELLEQRKGKAGHRNKSTAALSIARMHRGKPLPTSSGEQSAKRNFMDDFVGNPFGLGGSPDQGEKS